MLVVVDSCSWMTWLRKLPDKSPSSLIRALDSVAAEASSVPGIIRYSDVAGGALSSPEFNDWLKRCAIEPDHTSPIWAETPAHAAHSGEVAAALAAAGGVPSDWTSPHALRRLLQAMNDTRFESMGSWASPSEAAQFSSVLAPLVRRACVDRWEAAREQLRECAKAGRTGSAAACAAVPAPAAPSTLAVPASADPAEAVPPAAGRAAAEPTVDRESRGATMLDWLLTFQIHCALCPRSWAEPTRTLEHCHCRACRWRQTARCGGHLPLAGAPPATD